MRSAMKIETTPDVGESFPSAIGLVTNRRQARYVMPIRTNREKGITTNEYRLCALELNIG